MMRNGKKALSLLLALVLVVGMVPGVALAAEPTSGTCGDNVTWSLDNGVLTISGAGEMEDYYSTFIFPSPLAPWHNQCKQITSIVINEGVTCIGDDAFVECTNLANITIPNSVTSIGRDAFYCCSSLTSITIPNSVTSIGECAFSGCTHLTCVTIPDSVTSIEDTTFQECTSLTSVIIPKSVTRIGGYAFAHCRELTKIVIPNSVTHINFYAFGECIKLKDIYYMGSENQWSTITVGDDNYYLENATIHYNSTGPTQSEGESTNGKCGNNLTWTLDANGTLVIRGTGAMFDYDYLNNAAPWSEKEISKVIIEPGITKIGTYAFFNCNASEITIPSGITTIQEGTFYGSGFDHITIPDGVTSIGGRAFLGCSLVSISLPKTLSSVTNQAFYMSSLKDVYYAGTEADWKNVYIGPQGGYNSPLEKATMHYNSAGPDTPGPGTDTPTGNMKSVYFLSGWDVATRTVKFGDEEITPYTYTVANSVDVSNISSLLNKYVLVTMEQGGSALKYTITDIKSVESKIGTVSEVYRGEGSLAVTSFAIDGEYEYPVQNGNALSNLQWYKGKEILYHVSSGVIMSFDVLEEKHGVLGSWNSTTKKLTIGETEYPTNYLSDLSFMDNIRDYFQKDVTFLVADSTNYNPFLKITGLYHPYGDFNSDIYHANWLSQDTESSTMLGQKTPSQILSEQVSSTMGPTATVWQSFTGLLDGLDDVSTFKDLAFEKKDMYTAIILTAIEASYSVDVLPSEYSEYEEYIGLSSSFVSSVSNTMKAAHGYDITASGNLKKMTSEQQNTLQKAVDEWFKDNFPQLGDISEVLSGVKNGFKIMGDVEDLYEYVVSAIMLNTMSEDLKTVVRKAEELSKTSGNPDLALALADCVDIINSSAEQLEGKIAVRTTISLGLDFLFDEFQNQIQSVLCKSRPEVYILVKIYKVERDITDKFFKTDSIIEKYLKMMATLDVEELVGRTYDELRKEFLNSKNSNTARAYLRGMDIMYNMRKIDCSSANNYVDEIEGALANKVLQAFGKQSYNQLKTSIQNIQGSYKTAHVDAATNWINWLDADYPGAGLYEKYEYLFDQIRDSILNKEIKVACPVDVYIYDQQNNLVALVSDEQISCSVDDIAVAIMDSQKIIRMYNGADYRIEYVGNDNGDMDVTITEFDENAAPARTVNYYDIPLADKKTYYMQADDETMKPYNLVDKTNNSTVQQDYDSKHTGTEHTVKVISGTALQNDEIATEMKAGKGAQLQLNAYVPDGYAFVRWEVSNADATIEDSHSQSTTMVMPNTDVTVTAVLSAFTDVPSNAWYYGAVKFVSEQKLMNGIGNNLFAPQSNLSRAQLAQILYNKEGKPAVTDNSSFSDVSAGQWYTSAVIWANKQGIVGGYGNGLFGPNDDITREQLAVMLWRYAGKPATSGTTLNFTDADKVSSWALDAMRWATEKGIVNGKGNGILDPGGKATRAETAQMLKNFLEK